MSAYEVFLSSGVTVPPLDAEIDSLAELFDKYKLLEEGGGEWRLVQTIINRTGFSLELFKANMIAYTGHAETPPNLMMSIFNRCNVTMLTSTESSFKTKWVFAKNMHILSTGIKSGETLYFEGTGAVTLAGCCPEPPNV